MSDLISLANQRHSLHQLSYSISLPILRAFCVSMGHTNNHATAHLRHVSKVQEDSSVHGSLLCARDRSYLHGPSAKLRSLLNYTNQPIPGLQMCATSTINESFTAIYVPVFCFELLLFILAISVVFKHMKNTHTIAGKRIHSTMATLLKYNTIYFFVEMAGCGIATALYLGLPSIYLEITNSALIATAIILGNNSNLNHGSTSPNSSFPQPSLSGPFSSYMEMSMISAKAYASHDAA
ncbi:hypothetical protein BDR07DRAFT_230049 [Suillus spraguei]|nr:hypothetical protein BDR07DRAFT_230049 [Suillus spraguei]